MVIFEVPPSLSVQTKPQPPTVRHKTDQEVIGGCGELQHHDERSGEWLEWFEH